MFVHSKMSSMRFDFQKTTVASVLDIKDTDIFFNLTKIDTQLMNGGVPWRGGSEKDALSMQVFIESLTKPGGFKCLCIHM